jgi:3-methylcrotonyl-CoA carboxylase alpha subunit
MEMNTRLQVEHPVTEMTHGIDLVEWQLRIANGEPLPLTQAQVHSHGHAFEARLYAEDPDHGFLPSSGKLTRLRLPKPSPRVRLDGGVIEGDTVTIFYDPMIAKLIVWDVDRASALQRMREALADCEVVGPKSNVAFLERLVRHPAVLEGRIDTGYIDRHVHEFIAGDADPDPRVVFAAATVALLHDEAHPRHQPADPESPWNAADAWRVGRAGKRVLALARGSVRREIAAWGGAGNYQMQCGDLRCAVSGARWDGSVLSARLDDEARRFAARADADRVLLHDREGVRWRFARVPAYAWESTASAGGNQIVAPMPGKIVVVKAKAGDAVAAGQDVMVMEAMKMELALKAPRAGKIEAVLATTGDFVDADAVLVRFAEPAAS